MKHFNLFNKAFFFFVFAFFSFANQGSRLSAQCTAPTTQALIGNYTNNTTGTSLTINWARGNGNRVIVVGRLTATAAVDPISGTTYATPSATFGSGTAIGPGNFLVYSGTASALNVNGLSGLTSYTFTVYETNTTGNCYLTPGSSSAVSTPCIIPTSQSSTGVYTNNNTGNSITVNWTRGNGDSVIVVGRLTSVQAVDPVSGTKYQANTTFGSGSTTGTGNFVVYTGTGTTVNVTGLTAKGDYTFTTYEFKSISTCYRTPGSSRAIAMYCAAPANQASIGSYTNNTSGSSVAVNWTRGNGDSVIVVARLSTAASIAPVAGTRYTANSVFGTGTGKQITGTNNFVVYVGPGTSVNVTGLLLSKDYTFTVYEYASLNACYSLPGSSSTVRIGCVTPSNQATQLSVSNIDLTTLKLNWTRGNGTAGVLVIAKAGSAPTDPLSGTSYPANAAYGTGTAVGGGFAVYLGTGTSVNLTGLTPGTTYFFAVYEYNTTNTCYLTPGLAGSQATYCKPPYSVPCTGAFLNSVSIGTSGTLLDQPNTGCNGGYTDYTTVSVNLAQGGTFPIAINTNPIGSAISNQLQVWIDFNDNASFADNGELIGSFPSVSGAWSGNIIIPATAPVGKHRMRIRGSYSAASTNSCENQTYGEAHDYTANIQPPCTSPTTQAAITAYSNNTTGNSITVNWTRGNGDSVLVVGRLASSTNVNPSNWTPYSANSTFGSGSITGNGNFVVYSGKGTSVNVTGLSSGTIYVFTVYEFSSTGSCFNLPGSSGTVTTFCTAPTVQASIGNYSANTTGNSLTVNWTRGNGSGGVIVVGRLTSAAAADPVIGTTYTGNATFGSGSTTGTGNFVIYIGTGTSVNVTNLAGLSDYTFTVYEYNPNTCYQFPGSSSAVSTPCVLPTTQAKIGAYTNNTTGNSIRVNWTRGNGNNVIVIGRLTTTAAADPVVGTSYTANAVFGSGTAVGAGNYVVYAGAASAVTVTGLSGLTDYTFTVYELNTAGSCYLIPGSASAVSTICVTPATQAAIGLYTDNTSGTSVTVNWTRGGGDSVLVVGRLTATLAIDPSSGKSYPANPVFGSGSLTGAGNFVVYSGTGTSVKVTGLAQKTAYTFTVYEFNKTNTCYRTPGSSRNLTSICLAPTTQASIGSYTNNTTGNSLTVNWTRGNGDSVIVVGRLTATGAITPVQGTRYISNPIFGTGTGKQITGAGNFVVYVGTGNNVNVTGVLLGQNYTFTVYEYATTDACYLTTGTSSAVSVGCVTPATQASNLSFSNIGISSMSLKWTRGNGNGGVLVIAKATSAPTDPTIGVTYVGSPAFGTGAAVGGGFAVYNGTGTSVDVTGLTPGTTYYFAIYEYNLLNTCYLLPGLKGSQFLYCSPAVSLACTSTTLDSVSIGTAGSVLNHPATGCSANIVEYPNLSISMTQALSYPFNISSKAIGAQTSNNVTFWIDFNDDVDFSDTGEFIGTFKIGSNLKNFTGTITIPANAQTGKHRMRIRGSYSTGFAALSTSCESKSYGETHDYIVEILSNCSVAPPAPQTPSGATANMCEGSKQTYTVSAVNGATAYQWNLPSDWSGSSTSNSIEVTVGKTSGVITAQAINPCGTSSPSAALNVTVSPTPTFKLSASKTTIDVNESVTISSQVAGDSSNTWTMGDNVTYNNKSSVTHAYSQQGTYKVIFSATNKVCSKTDTITIQVNNPTGIEALENKINVFAFNGDIYLDWSNNNESLNAKITILNTLGQVVEPAHSLKNTTKPAMISTNLPSGVYLVSIMLEDGRTITRKIVSGVK